MAWQDELNSLDQELSSGRIRAEEYRRRRDELLAAASSNPVSLRRLHRQQQPSIANAFQPEVEGVPPQVDLTQAQWEAKPPSPQRTQALNAGPVPPVRGDEVFGLAIDATAKRRKWPQFVVAIVVLALVAGAVWWFALRDTTPDNAPAAAPTTGLSLDKVPNPTDVPLSTAGVLTVDQAQVYNLLKPDEAANLSTGGVEKIYYRGATAGSVGYLVYAFQTKDSATGKQLSEKIVKFGKDTARQDAGVAGLPDGVTAAKLITQEAAIFDAVYPIDSGAVRIVLLQTGQVDERQLSNSLKRAVDRTVQSLPPVR
jgi:hypothetical protein